VNSQNDLFKKFNLNFLKNLELLYEAIEPHQPGEKNYKSAFFLLLDSIVNHFIQKSAISEQTRKESQNFFSKNSETYSESILTVLNDFKKNFDIYPCHLSEIKDCNHEFCLSPSILSILFEKNYPKSSKKDRKKKLTGVYYTPKTISKYIVQNSIENSLLLKINLYTNMEYKGISDIFKENSTKLTHLLSYLVTEILPSLKILDNACGTGEFLLTSVDTLIEYWVWFLDELKKLNNNLFKEVMNSLNEKFIHNVADLEGLKDKNQLQYFLKEAIIRNNIFGVDIDQDSLKIATYRLFLSLIAEIKTSTIVITNFLTLEGHLRKGNSLLGYLQIPKNLYSGTQDELKRHLDEEYLEKIKKKNSFLEKEQPNIQNLPLFHWPIEFPELKLEKEGFDIILGNPPYIRSRHLSPLDRLIYSQIFTTAYRTFDIYLFFIERSLQLLHNGQILSYLIPYSFLHQPYATKLREMLLKLSTILEIVDLSEIQIFDANIATCILTIQKGFKPSQMTIATFKEQKITPLRTLNPKIFLKNSDYMFKIELTPKHQLIINKIEKNSIPLSKIMHISKGVEVYERGSGQTKDEFIRSSNPEQIYKPYLEAKEIKRYKVLWRQRYLDYQPDRHCSPKYPELFENPKIIMRRIIGKKRLTTTLDTNHFYVENTLICCLPKKFLLKKFKFSLEDLEVSKEYDLKLVLGILNSKLMTYYFKIKLGDKLQIYNKAVEALPLPKIDDQNKTLIDQIINNVSDLLNRIERSPDVYEYQEIIDEKIDQLVLKLYNLTKDEKKIILESMSQFMD
jgi:hypothetical protein